MKKLFISVVVFISLLGGSATSVGAATVTNSNKNNSIVSVNHVKRQRKHMIYHIRRNRIANHSNHSKVVVIRFNRRKAAEYKMKKHENGNVVATDSHRLVQFNNINNNKDFTANSFSNITISANINSICSLYILKNF